MPWLRSIVRNEAYMKLRRGGPYRKERPFSSLVAHPDADTAPNFGSIDSLLAHAIDNAERSQNRYADPSDPLSRKETLESLRELLHCLSARERAVFEAHFFRELPPERIALLYGMTAKNVRNAIFRLRAKVQRERVRVTIRAYLAERRVYTDEAPFACRCHGTDQPCLPYSAGCDSRCDRTHRPCMGPLFPLDVSEPGVRGDLL